MSFISFKSGAFRLLSFITVLFLAAVAIVPAESKEDRRNPVVRIETNLGDIDLELFKHAAPETVENFIGLLEGTKEFTNPKTSATEKRKYYDGLIFHRVIDNFMIQSGCPLGTGTSGPGYLIADEMDADALGLDDLKALSPNGQPHQYLMVQSQEDFNQKVVRPVFAEFGITNQEELDEKKDEVNKRIRELTVKDVLEFMGYEYRSGLKSYAPVRGSLAMANSGPNTNGPQFFINLVDTPWLTGKHTVFGKVLEGMDIVENIGKQKTDQQGRPETEIEIISMNLIN